MIKYVTVMKGGSGKKRIDRVSIPVDDAAGIPSTDDLLELSQEANYRITMLRANFVDLLESLEHLGQKEAAERAIEHWKHRAGKLSQDVFKEYIGEVLYQHNTLRAIRNLINLAQKIEELANRFLAKKVAGIMRREEAAGEVDQFSIRMPTLTIPTVFTNQHLFVPAATSAVIRCIGAFVHDVRMMIKHQPTLDDVRKRMQNIKWLGAEHEVLSIDVSFDPSVSFDVIKPTDTKESIVEKASTMVALDKQILDAIGDIETQFSSVGMVEPLVALYGDCRHIIESFESILSS